MTLLNAKTCRWFLTGFGLVNTVTFTFILMALTFISGHTLAFWHFPVSILCALLVNQRAARYFMGSGYINPSPIKA